MAAVVHRYYIEFVSVLVYFMVQFGRMNFQALLILRALSIWEPLNTDRNSLGSLSHCVGMCVGVCISAASFEPIANPCSSQFLVLLYYYVLLLLLL